MSGLTRIQAGALVRCARRGEAARAVPHLLVRPPGGGERAVALATELTVGRGPEAGLVIADGGASRLHACLRLSEDGAAAVEDLGSKNGVRLNGLPLGPGPAPLRPGDELLVGSTVLRYEDPLAEPAGSPTPGAVARVEAVRPTPVAPGGRRAEVRLLAAAAALLGLAALLLTAG